MTSEVEMRNFGRNRHAGNHMAALTWKDHRVSEAGNKGDGYWISNIPLELRIAQESCSTHKLE